MVNQVLFKELFLNNNSFHLNRRKSSIDEREILNQNGKKEKIMTSINVKTSVKEELIDITAAIEIEIKEAGYQNGLIHIFIPHTTAAVTINENADPDVTRDIIHGLKRIVPEDGYHHMEGNSPAHIKSSMFGPSLTVNLENGNLILGTWQGIYFCEFDGPRNRKAMISFYPQASEN